MSTETEERPRVYLNNVHLKGFKSIEDLTIDFKKGLNILIGRNGAGKSNLMELLNQVLLRKDRGNIHYTFASVKFMSEDGHEFELETEQKLKQVLSDDDYFDNRIESIEKFSVDNNVKFQTSTEPNNLIKFDFLKKNDISFKGSLRGLFVNMGYQPVYPLYLTYNIPDLVGFISSPTKIEISTESPFYIWNYFPETLSFLRSTIQKIERFYDLESNNISSLTKSKIIEQLRIQDNIIENLKHYTTIEDVRFNDILTVTNDHKSLVIQNIILEFKTNGKWLSWSQLSDGTRRLFYIIAEVTHTSGIILLEEPELGIHPHQFNLLMDFLKEQSEDKQIIISTHSPKALDHLSPDELDHILIAYYDLEKGTQIRHLSDKEINKAQKYMKEVGFFSDYWMLSDLE